MKFLPKFMTNKRVTLPIILGLAIVALIVSGISFDTIRLALMAGMVFLFAALGELFDQRAGVLNIGLEGMMLVGALTAILVSGALGNPWYGIMAAVGTGGIMGLIHGFNSISLKVSQVVSGTGIWLFGFGVTTYIGSPVTGPVSNPLTTKIGGFSPLFYIGLALVPIFWFILFKTNFGLKLRSVGEDPSVAEASGISVYKMRYIAVIVGGALSGLAGAYVSMVYATVWTTGLTAGRGFIALAIVFFSMWRPFVLLGGSIGFGALWIASLKLQGVIPGVSSNLLKTIPYILTIVVLALMSLERFRRGTAAPNSLAEPYFPED